MAEREVLASDAGTIPSDIVDAHVHVMDPRFPYAASRAYTPGSATPSMLRAHLEEVGANRVVIVQASPYGADNTALVNAVEELGHDVARGVAVVDGNATAETAARLAAAGVVGLRLNAPLERLSGNALVDRFTRLTQLAAAQGLHVSLHARPADVAALAPWIVQTEVAVVVEHFGQLPVTPEDSPEGATLLRLLGDGHVWVKLSGVYKIASAPHWTGASILAARLVTANPDRVVWGSDWPHTAPGTHRASRPVDEVEPFQDIDDPAALRATLAGISRTLRHQVLSANPTRLFGFA